jgi:hypothetical protein
MADGKAAMKNEIKIRAFEPGDESAVIDLWHRCGLVVPWNDPATDITMGRRIDS